MSDRRSMFMVLSAVFALAVSVRGGEGRVAVQITSDPAWDYHPRWSPDGSMIAFTSHRHGGPSLWIMPAEGGEAREIVAGVKGDFHISWSPDGSSIAFDADGPNGSPDIWTISVRGGKPTRITTFPGGDAHPAWSADGSRIAFTSFRSGNSDVWTIAAAGGNAKQITRHPDSDLHPRWSVDGSKIAFTSKRSGNLDIWTIPATGGTAVQVTKDPADDDCAYWSGDGSAILFSSERSGNWDIWMVPAESGEATRITSSLARDGWPSCSPDGSKIAFNSDRSGNLDLWIVEVGDRDGESTSAAWPQWGGPSRNFTVKTEGLADKWPDGGPRKLWHRTLGDGYSSIVYDDGVLYTMYRKERTNAEEFAVALDAQTGGTVWEHGNHSPLLSRDDSGWGGQGPNATPLIVDDRLYTIGSRSMLHCFDKKTGKVLWKHDLVREYRAPVNQHVGYPCSPIAYKQSIIVPVDRKRPDNHSDQPNERADGQTLAAFDQATGKLLWKALDFRLSEASPILVKFDGQDQLVCSTRHGLLGVDPNDGSLLWRHPEMGSIVSPVWNGGDLLFYTSGGDDAIGRVVKLTKQEGKTVPDELWVNKKIRMWQPTPVQVDGCLYGSTSQLLLGVDMKTGKRLWAKRGFPVASCVYGDDKLIILDQDGQLTLATATPDGLTVHSQCKITERYSFTVPTLVGKLLYVRDRKHIMALDLS